MEINNTIKTAEEIKHLLPNLKPGSSMKLGTGDGLNINRTIIEVHRAPASDHNGIYERIAVVLEVTTANAFYFDYEPRKFWVQRTAKGWVLIPENQDAECHGGQTLGFLCFNPRHGSQFSATEVELFTSHYAMQAVHEGTNHIGQTFRAYMRNALHMFLELDRVHDHEPKKFAYMLSTLECKDLELEDYQPICINGHDIMYTFELDNLMDKHRTYRK